MTTVAVGVFTVAAAGCGSSSAATTNASPEPVATVSQSAAETPEPDPDQSIRPYIEAVADLANPGAMRQGLDHAVPGSTAYVYLDHRINIAESALDAGSAYRSETVSTAGGGAFEVCSPGVPAADGCGIFGDFETSGGLVSSLTVDGQDPGPRMTAGNGDIVTDRGVSAEFLTAYDSIAAGSLWVTVRLSTEDPIYTLLNSTTYRSPDGRQRVVSDVIGDPDLRADSTTMITVVFPGVTPGGQVIIEGMDADYQWDFELVLDVG